MYCVPSKDVSGVLANCVCNIVAVFAVGVENINRDLYFGGMCNGAK